jgi:hypothetical protein
MNIILFDGNQRENLLPLTFTKPVGALRMGILSFAERWEKLLNAKVSYQTESYLQGKFETILASENIFINPAYFPTTALVTAIKELVLDQSITYKGQLVAAKTTQSTFDHIVNTIDFTSELKEIQYP